MDVAGSGWFEGKRMSVRVTRKVGHLFRLWELDETYHTVGIQVRRGWWRRRFVSECALGQVRRVEDVMCSEQVQQDGAGGEGAQSWIGRDATLLILGRNEFKN